MNAHELNEGEIVPQADSSYVRAHADELLPLRLLDLDLWSLQ